MVITIIRIIIITIGIGMLVMQMEEEGMRIIITMEEMLM
jgi:hypothetical protein